jgi:hypothetical protein
MRSEDARAGTVADLLDIVASLRTAATSAADAAVAEAEAHLAVVKRDVCDNGLLEMPVRR